MTNDVIARRAKEQIENCRGVTRHDRMHATRDVDTSKVGAEKPAVGIKAPATFWEKVLFVLSRHRETSIAVIALILVIYFQVGSNGGVFLRSLFVGRRSGICQ